LGIPLPTEGVRSSNHDQSCDRRDGWVGLSSTREITREPLVDDGKSFQGERNGALLRADGVVRLKKCLTGETLLEMAYYHEDRIHIGLEKTTPARRPVEARPNQARNVMALSRIGCLHHRYTWSPAA